MSDPRNEDWISLERVHVFLSYSQLDRPFAKALHDLLEQRGVNVWWDQDLLPGDRFRHEILQRIDRADKVIVLWSSRSQESDFVRDEADAARMRGKLIPLKLDACEVPLGFREYHFTSIQHGDFASRLDSILRALGISAGSAERAERRVLFKPRTDISRLPITYSAKLFGRDEEMVRLFEAWDSHSTNKTNIVVLDAIGGSGKTTLVHHFVQTMARSDWRGAQAAYAWSFYSQGTGDRRHASADEFLERALAWFGYAGPPIPTQHDKGVELAGLIARQRTLLVLDGLEPLQYPAGRGGGGRGTRGIAGSLKDFGLAALLTNLAIENDGLLIITSRLELAELKRFPAPRVDHMPLDGLKEEAGRDLLKSHGIKGSTLDLELAVDEFHGHPLALTTLAGLIKLTSEHDPDIRRRDTVPSVVEVGTEEDRDPFRVMQAYETLYQHQIEEQEKGGQRAADTAAAKQLAILRMLGLFDRPAEAEVVDALLDDPLIPGLTDGFVGLSRQQWAIATGALRNRGLIAKIPEAGHERSSVALDAHPLIREYFALKLAQDHPEIWHLAHGRLAKHYETKFCGEDPQSLDEMVGIGYAISHAALAGRLDWASDLYARKIRRKVQEKGLYPFDISVLLSFFNEPWQSIDPRVPEDRRSLLYWQAAGSLRGSGRLKEAAEALESSCEMLKKQGAWRLYLDHWVELLQIRLKLGQLDRTIEAATEAEEFAIEKNIPSQLPDILCFRGRAHHQRGDLKSADADFKASTSAAKRDDQPPKIDSFRQFAINDFHLDNFRTKVVRKWTKKTLEESVDPGFIAKKGVTASALDKLSLGRLSIIEAMRTPSGPDHDKLLAAREYIEASITDLRNTRQLDELPGALILRASLRRHLGNQADAQKDLTEAIDISERFGMPLFCVDSYLEEARLVRSRGEFGDNAVDLINRAEALIGEAGYDRRRADVIGLREEIKVEMAKRSESIETSAASSQLPSTSGPSQAVPNRKGFFARVRGVWSESR